MKNEIDDNLAVYTQIDTFGAENEIYSLSALLCKNGNYVMFSLVLPDDLGENNFWDSEAWLYNLLIQLRKWRARKIDVEVEELLNNEEFIIPEADFEDVLNVLEKGDSLGFFKEIKQK